MAVTGDALAGPEKSSAEREVPGETTTGPDGRRFRTVALALTVVAVSITMIIVAMRLQPPLTTVRVAAGLEFFENAEVRDILRGQGIQVRRTPVGSMSLTTPAELQKYDAIIPGGKIAADQVAQTLRTEGEHPNRHEAFFSPMVVVTYDPIIELLQRIEAAPAGGKTQPPRPLVRKDPDDGTWRLNVAAYLAEVHQKRRWTTIPGNTGYDNPNRMLITTTNPARSNSAAMFVAISSAATNNGDVVENEAAADAAVTAIKACFTAQGDTPDSTADSMAALLVAGMKSVPMGLAYENDFIAARRDRQNADNGLNVMYPEPTVTSANTMISRTAGGQKLGDALKENPKLQALLRESGYRTESTTPGEFRELMDQKYGIAVSAELYTVQVPEATLLKRMIDAVKS
jgi:hypothetical protein